MEQNYCVGISTLHGNIIHVDVKAQTLAKAFKKQCIHERQFHETSFNTNVDLAGLMNGSDKVTKSEGVRLASVNVGEGTWGCIFCQTFSLAPFKSSNGSAQAWNGCASKECSLTEAARIQILPILWWTDLDISMEVRLLGESARATPMDVIELVYWKAPFCFGHCRAHIFLVMAKCCTVSCVARRSFFLIWSQTKTSILFSTCDRLRNPKVAASSLWRQIFMEVAVLDTLFVRFQNTKHCLRHCPLFYDIHSSFSEWQHWTVWVWDSCWV